MNDIVQQNDMEIYRVAQITERDGRYSLNWHGRYGSELVDALTAASIISQGKHDGTVEMIRPGLFKFGANEYGRLTDDLEKRAETAAKWAAGCRTLTRAAQRPRGRVQRMMGVA